jgi:hypothetical protein
MAHRNLWLIDMGDGTWAVCCTACRRALFRGPRPVADRVFASHRCEPVIPLSRSRRGGGRPSPPPTAAPLAAPDRTQRMNGCAAQTPTPHLVKE